LTFVAEVRERTGPGTLRADLEAAVRAVRAHAALEPRVGIIVGPGLGGLAASIDAAVTIPGLEIPGLGRPSAESNSGTLLVGTLGSTPVVCMHGRHQHYEGHVLREVTFPVRVMKALGADVLLVASACGALNPLWAVGELVLIHDHINFLGDNPLIGPNDDELGPRFPDMSEPYDSRLQESALGEALELGAGLQRGVYVAVAGPSLETRAECRMLRSLGADVVGRSVVPDVIVARHMGMRVLGLGVVTDVCWPDAPAGPAETIRPSDESGSALARLVERIVAHL
jgi:purine-nucleoside phosphorylase